MDGILIIFMFALGACLGSFLNVVIHRLPRGESIVFPGSHCPACGRAIRWYDNIPLVSWLALRAKCRDCKAPISPRYLLVELLTAVLVCGLFVAFYVARVRAGVGSFLDTWPTFFAYAALFCGLLACSIVDIESWIIPLEICWFVSLVGIVAAGASVPPAELLPRVSPTTGAMTVAAAVGLAAALVLLHLGYLQRSFLDAEEPPLPTEDGGRKAGNGEKDKPPPAGVAYTKQHGVNPRVEAFREVLFLAPAIGLAIAAGLLVTHVPPVRNAWLQLTGPEAGTLADHVNALLAAGFGYLIGGLWIWGFRIGGTLAFGKEAIGLGDVHILAAAGAVCGYGVPSMAFVLAAFLALAWAVTIFLSRRQRELPYGPWLATGALVAVLLYDHILVLLEPYLVLFREPAGGPARLMLP